MKRVIILAGLVAAAALGCTHQSYTYAPVEQASASIGGRPAASYALPGGSGTVRIATMGLANVGHVDQARGRSVTAMHVRMEVSNRSASPMTVDTREQIAHLDRYGTSYPALYASEGSVSPIVTVPPGEARSIELFYPILEPVIGTQLVPRFDVALGVHTGSGPMNARTNFDRHVL